MHGRHGPETSVTGEEAAIAAAKEEIFGHGAPEAPGGPDTVLEFPALPVDLADLECWRAQFRYRVLREIRDMFRLQEAAHGLTPETLAARLGKETREVRAFLDGQVELTFGDVSDTLRAMGARMDFGAVRLEDIPSAATPPRRGPGAPALVTDIVYFGRPTRVACDRRCTKAWGVGSRPKVRLSDDPDDYVFLADHELGEAPADPGTYEGGEGKPMFPERHNKWCVRECERSAVGERGEMPELPDFDVPRHNIPRKAA